MKEQDLFIELIETHIEIYFRNISSKLSNEECI
jgi:hypothetical protein